MDGSFIRRHQRPVNLEPAASKGREVYLPKNAKELTDADYTIWNITDADCMQIYFTNADHLFEEFEDYLNNTSSSQSAQDAVEETTRQHVNKVKLIWQTLDPDLTMFPKSTLGDRFCFEDQKEMSLINSK